MTHHPVRLTGYTDGAWTLAFHDQELEYFWQLGETVGPRFQTLEEAMRDGPPGATRPKPNPRAPRRHPFPPPYRRV